RIDGGDEVEVGLGGDGIAHGRAHPAPRTEHPHAGRHGPDPSVGSVHYGLSLPNVGPTAELLRLTTTAEASGWDGVFLWDHLHLRRELRLDVVDPWVMIGAQAVSTERVRLGALVTPLARRRPWKMAKEVVTAD